MGSAIARFSVHFDGPITTDHKLTVRSMSRTYEHMQRAIDRAYLIEKYGSVWKHARLSGEDYESTSFIAEYPREGGIFLDAVKGGVLSGKIVDRISEAIKAPFERAAKAGLEEAVNIGSQIIQRRNYASNVGLAQIQSLDDLLEKPPAKWTQAYSNRSILKEVDQLTSQITPDECEGSIVELALYGTTSRLVFKFTPEIATRFHRYVSGRELGPAVAMRAKLRNLDRGNKFAKPKAKVLNLASKREAVLHLNGEQDFLELHPYHTAEEVSLLVCPILEAGGFDVHSGDLFFLAVLG